MLAAAFTLTNCAKEIENPNENQSAGIPFEIVASTADTKTVNDGMHTNWAEGDQINLFHAVTDATTYTNDKAFKVTDLEGGKFSGTLTGTLDPQEEYDWYAFYPYTSQISTPANKSTYVTVASKTNGVQTQNGNNSMAHIAGANYPLAGKAYATSAGSTPELKMNHVTSLLEVVVTNATEEPLTVTEIIFNAPELIVGTFYVNFADEITPASFVSSGESYTSKTAKLAVNNGEAIAKGASAKFYLAVKPFDAEAGETLELYVNGSVKEIELSKAVSFTAGKIKTLNYTYESKASGPEAITIAEFLEKEVNAAVWYELTGVVTNIVSTQYGNFDLVDETGTVYVYGLTQTKVASNNQSFSKLGLKEGDVVTMMGTRAVYNSQPQVGGPAYYVSHIAACAAPVISFEDNVVTITTTEVGATIYYTTNGEKPTTASFVYEEPIELEEGDEFTVNAIVVAEGKATSPVASRPCKWSDPNASVGTPSSVACYTLSTASQQGSNNSYAGNCDITVSGIKWNVNGNTQINPWRIGGKSITKVDRTVYSKTAYADALSKVEFVSGTTTATWNSMTLIYSTNADFSDAMTMTASGIGANKTIAFEPDGGFPAGCYFKFVLNVTNTSTSSNKYVQLKEIKFYGYE
jgi:hypothetical protein